MSVSSTSSPDIQFHFLLPVSLARRGLLKQYLNSRFNKEKKKLASLHYIFCSDAYLLKINKDFLGHDFYTDIVTFDLSEKGGPIQGEIYISIDRVRDNARQMGLSIKEELHRVIFHGALHLCGYKDKSAKDIKEMRAHEEKWLSGYFSVL